MQQMWKLNALLHLLSGLWDVVRLVALILKIAHRPKEVEEKNKCKLCSL
jgi:hypothetical protein